MVSRFAQIVNAFLRRTFGEQSPLRCRRHDRHDTRRGGHFVHLPYFEKYEPVSSETYLPEYRILLCTHKLSDVSRIVAQPIHGGRRKGKKYCRRSSVEDVRETLCKAKKLLPPAVVDKRHVQSHACKPTT